MRFCFLHVRFSLCYILHLSYIALSSVFAFILHCALFSFCIYLALRSLQFLHLSCIALSSFFAFILHCALFSFCIYLALRSLQFLHLSCIALSSVFAFILHCALFSFCIYLACLRLRLSFCFYLTSNCVEPHIYRHNQKMKTGNTSKNTHTHKNKHTYTNTTKQTKKQNQRRPASPVGAATVRFRRAKLADSLSVLLDHHHGALGRIVMPLPLCPAHPLGVRVVVAPQVEPVQVG